MDSMANKVNDENVVILFSGEYSGNSHYAERNLYSLYTEDNYPTIDGITYQLDGETAVAIHVEIEIKEQEGFTLPETIEYKDTAYTVVEKYDQDKVFKENDIKGVIHFAAFSLVGESMTNPYKYYENNVSKTNNVKQKVNNI